MNRLIGTDISQETMLSYFKKLDLGYDEAVSYTHIDVYKRQELPRTKSSRVRIHITINTRVYPIQISLVMI